MKKFKKIAIMNWVPSDDQMNRMVSDEFMERYGFNMDSINATDRQKARALRAVSERINPSDGDPR